MYAQGFDYEAIMKKSESMFKHIKFSETTYEGVVEPSYKTTPYKWLC